MTSGPDLTNLLSPGSRSITYNADNMPTAVSHTNGSVTKIMNLTYDGGGARAIKSVSGGATTFYVGGHFEVSQSGTGTETTRFIFAGNLRIAQIKGGRASFFHKDHLGSSTIMSNSSGTALETSEYLPFGGQRSHTGSAVSNYKFTDQEFDPESGLYNYNARLYDPVLGKFVTADTIVPDPSSPQTLNRYSYCYNNPLIYVDPDGHFGFLGSIILGAIIGGVTSEASGGDFWDGALTGAISGAVFFGAGELVNAGVNSVVAHTGAGMLSGGINAGISGGDIGMGILTGGISGGLGEFGGGFLPKDFGSQFVGRTLIGGVTGGISSELYGGSFGDGFMAGMRTGATGYLCNHMAHEWFFSPGAMFPRVIEQMMQGIADRFSFSKPSNLPDNLGQFKGYRATVTAGGYSFSNDVYIEGKGWFKSSKIDIALSISLIGAGGSSVYELSLPTTNATGNLTFHGGVIGRYGGISYTPHKAEATINYGAELALPINVSVPLY